MILTSETDREAENVIAAIEKHADPIMIFGQWLAEACASELNDANAMTLSTADADGRPSSRVVLLKSHNETGFVFYTNLESRKGLSLRVNPWAALGFHWKSLRRQIRIEGLALRVTDCEADNYFATRGRESQIGAWASLQSQRLVNRERLMKRIEDLAAKFGNSPIPRPPHWSGVRIVPLKIEFWQERLSRLHDRIIFERETQSAPWTCNRQYP